MSVSVKFTRIIQESVTPELPGIFSQLYSPLNEDDPLLNDIINWFELPPYDKALTHYKSIDPKEGEIEVDPMTITYCYKWILQGFIEEVNINILTADDREIYLKGLHELFEGWQPAKEKYLSEIEKLNNLPSTVAFNFSSQIAIYSRAAKGAVELISEGLKHIDALSSKSTSINTQGQESFSLPITNVNEKRNTFNPPMPLSEVEKWFMQLATRKNKNGQNFLTKDEALQFISQAFLKEERGHKKLKVNYGTGSKWNFVRLFFDYYWYCTTSRRDNLRPLDERPNIRDEYIKLLTDNFEGFDFDEVKKNFSNKIGQTWTV